MLHSDGPLLADCRSFSECDASGGFPLEPTFNSDVSAKTSLSVRFASHSGPWLELL